VAFLQSSVIQNGCNAGAVADDIDYGPYTSDQWARLYETFLVGDQSATQGVFRGFANEFLVSGAGVAVTVKTGAGLCNGHFIVGSGAPAWTVNVTPPTLAHTRCDYVVMLENNTAGVYAPGVATMECPGTADYGGIANQVPEYSCRLAVIKGAEDAACPPAAISQTAALWMTPLASIEWNVAQTIDTVTDMRHYVHEYSTRIWVPATSGYDLTGGASIFRTGGGGYGLPVAVHSLVYGDLQIPDDYVRDLGAVAVVFASCSAFDVYLQNTAFYAATGEAYLTHTDTTGYGAIAIGAVNTYQEVRALTLPDQSRYDHIIFRLNRDATDVLDTCAGTLYIRGWIVTYTAALSWS